MRRSTVVFLLLVLGTVISAWEDALADTELQPRDRLRVEMTSADGETRRVEGILVSSDEDGLVIRSKDEAVTTIPLGSITRVDRFAGRQGHALVGALIGLGGGTALGIIVRERIQQDDLSQDSVHPGLIVVFGALGAGLGALVGNVIETDQWDRLDSISVGVAPDADGRSQLAVTWSFDL